MAKFYMEKLFEREGIYNFLVESAGLNVMSDFSLQPPTLAIEATKNLE